MTATTNTTADYTGKIEWEYTKINELETITDDGSVGEKIEFVDDSGISLGVTEVWYVARNISPQTLLSIDFSLLPVAVPGGTVYEAFSNIKALNIRNVSGDLVYVGDSGVSDGIGVFGTRQTIGISGVMGWESAVGRIINASQHNIGIYNPSTTGTIAVSVGVVGNPES